MKKALLDRPARRAAVAAGSCLLVAGVLAACGSSASDGSAASGSAAPSGAADFTAYQQCLSEHGVTLPSRGAGQPGDTPPSGFPSGGPGGGAPSGAPTGDPGAGGPGGGVPGGVLPSGVDASAFQAAQEACASLRPTGGFGGGQGIDQSALAAYRSCLSDHGVTVTGRIDQLSTADPTTAAALATCAPLRPTLAPRPSASPSTSTA